MRLCKDIQIQAITDPNICEQHRGCWSLAGVTVTSLSSTSSIPCHILVMKRLAILSLLCPYLLSCLISLLSCSPSVPLVSPHFPSSSTFLSFKSKFYYLLFGPCLLKIIVLNSSLQILPNLLSSFQTSLKQRPRVVSRTNSP